MAPEVWKALATFRIDVAHANLPRHAQVFAVQDPLFFGAVAKFERVLAQIRADPRVVIIRLHDVSFMDITGLQALEGLLQQMLKRGAQVLVCEANARVTAKLERAEVITGVKNPSYAETFAAAVASPNGSRFIVGWR